MSNPTSGRSFRQSVDHMVDRAIAEMELEPGVCKAIKASTSVLHRSPSRSRSVTGPSRAKSP